jgi:hypothetical protein
MLYQHFELRSGSRTADIPPELQVTLVVQHQCRPSPNLSTIYQDPDSLALIEYPYISLLTQSYGLSQ